MADEHLILRKLVQRFGRMRTDDRLRVLNQLSPTERVILERLGQPPVDPNTLLSVGFAERIETLRDGQIAGVTERGREAMLALAAKSAPGAPTAPMPHQLSLAEKVGKAFSRWHR